MAVEAGASAKEKTKFGDNIWPRLPREGKDSLNALAEAHGGHPQFDGCGSACVDFSEQIFIRNVNFLRIRGNPKHIRADSGAEMVTRCLRHWLRLLGTKTVYITLGSP